MVLKKQNKNNNNNKKKKNHACSKITLSELVTYLFPQINIHMMKALNVSQPLFSTSCVMGSRGQE